MLPDDRFTWRGYLKDSGVDRYSTPKSKILKLRKQFQREYERRYKARVRKDCCELVVTLSKSEHKVLKKEAQDRGQTMSKVVRDSITEFVMKQRITKRTDHDLNRQILVDLLAQWSMLKQLVSFEGVYARELFDQVEERLKRLAYPTGGGH